MAITLLFCKPKLTFMNIIATPYSFAEPSKINVFNDLSRYRKQISLRFMCPRRSLLDFLKKITFFLSVYLGK